MEIFEKKHPIGFAINLFLHLTMSGISGLALFTPLLVEQVNGGWPIIIMIIVVFGTTSILFFIFAVDFCTEYKHLVIDKKPAIIINDDSITYYAFYSRKYVTFKLEDIKEFKFISNKMGGFIQPVFKNPELAKKYKYRTYLMHFTIVARIDYLEDGYSNIIYILNHIIDDTYFEDIYKKVKGGNHS